MNLPGPGLNVVGILHVALSPSLPPSLPPALPFQTEYSYLEPRARNPWDASDGLPSAVCEQGLPEPTDYTQK